MNESKKTLEDFDVMIITSKPLPNIQPKMHTRTVMMVMHFRCCSLSSSNIR